MRDRDRALVHALAGDNEDSEKLAFAIVAADSPFHVAETQLQECYQTVGYWYAVAKDRKRRALGEDKLDWQLREDLLEAWVKGLDRALMTRLHLNKLTERLSR